MKATKKKANNVNDINLPKEDIRVEKGQSTFLPVLKTIVKKKK
jgi:hypothetical protein